jgi:hypothetical protein
MSDPLNYREPGTEEPATERGQRARYTCGVGLIVLLSSIVVVFIPVVVPFGAQAKYLIVTALVGAAIGFSILLNGAIDWLRGK